MIKEIKKYSHFAIFYLTIIVSCFYGEDTLGGSKGDYTFHLKFLELFNNDLIYGIKIFGYENFIVRNSPVFYIILSYLDNFISVENIKYLNSISSILIAVFFFKCLKLKYKKIEDNKLILLSCIIFISPTIRSLSAWPYPFIWGLLFLVISYYYFLKFLEKKNIKNNKYYSLFFLSISSYLHINFCIFGIFYIYKFFKFHKFGFEFTKLLIFCLVLSLPAIYFIFFRSGIYFFIGAEGLEVTYKDIFNFSNKIIIISTILLYFIIPIINPAFLFQDFKKKINYKYTIILLLIFIFLAYYFNYPYTDFFGGGVFFKISNLLFGNNFLFFIFALISFLVLFTISEGKTDNYLLFLLLILYNLQFTIYNKYYDPLLIIMFFLMFEFNLKRYFFYSKNFLLKIYFFLLIYYFFNIFKTTINLS